MIWYAAILFNNYSTSSSCTWADSQWGAEVPSWLSTHYDESEWNNCFIIYSIFSCCFVFSEVAFSRRVTISASVGSANLTAILNFTTHRIWAEILVVKEPIRELRCHYLVTCVYNKIWYMICYAMIWYVIWYGMIWYNMLYDMIIW